MQVKKEKSSICMLFSNNINRLMNENGKSRKEVCRDLDIKYTTFCDWVNGRIVPKPAQIDLLSEYFHVSPSFFFIEQENNAHMKDRLELYTKKTKELPMNSLEGLSDEQVRELLKTGFTFQHKTLEQYMEFTDGQLILSEKLDWGNPLGREIW